MLPRGVPIQVAATHLNSHRASGTDDHDANAAYYRQVDLLSRFIAADRNLRLPLVVAGDFNTFPAVRRDYLSRESRSWPAADSLERLTAVASSAVGSLLRSAKDREFYASGATARIAPVGIAVPFGREADGSMLSNHVGFAIDYRVDRFSRSPRLGNS